MKTEKIQENQDENKKVEYAAGQKKTFKGVEKMEQAMINSEKQ